MKALTSLLIFFSILWFPQFLSAGETSSQTIRGRVIDKTTLTPLPGATVILLDKTPFTGTTTDPDGRFRLEGVEVGRVSLKITFIGYAEVILNNLMLNTGKELVLEIEMEEMVFQQEEVVISATADKSAPINTMATVSARGFTVEETSRYAGARNDVARMAQNFAGVTGANDARNDIIIRGNSPMGLLWQLEGIPIPNPNHYGSPTASGGPVSMLNNNVLMNSDFLTGAFPASYGNAMSGVFDLRMRNGNDEKHEFLGQVGFNGFELGAEGPIHRESGASYLTNFRYSTLELMDKLGADLGTGTGVPKYKDFTAKINLPRTKLGSVSVFILAGTSDIEIWDSRKDTTDTKVDFYAGEGYDLTNSSDMITGGINQFKLWSSKTYSRLILSASYHRFVTNVDSLAPVSLAKTAVYQNDLRQTSLTARFILNHKINVRNNLTGGITVRNTAFDLDESNFYGEDAGLRKISDYDGSSVLYQAYAEWQHRFSDAVTLNTGLHGMLYGLNSTSSLEPRAGLTWKSSADNSFSLGYGLHSMLNPISVYFRQTRMADGSFALLNEDLPYMKGHHFVVAWDKSINTFTRIKTEAYYQRLFDAAVDGGEQNSFSLLNEGANFGFGTPDTLIATGKGENIGLELTFERFLNKGLYYLLTASVFDSQYTGSDDKWRSTAFNGNYVFNLLVGKEWQLGGKASKPGKSKYSLGFDLKSTYAGGQRYTPSVVMPDVSGTNNFSLEYDIDRAYSLQYDDYNRTDIKISFKINGKRTTQEFALDIQNVLNQKNIYNERFNKETGEKSFTYQMGMLIIPQYRIIF
jgi:hypothetical protein